MSSAPTRRLSEISLELRSHWLEILQIAGDLNKKLRVLGDDEQADKTLAYIKEKGISPADIYIALVDTYGPPTEEKPQEATA